MIRWEATLSEHYSVAHQASFVKHAPGHTMYALAFCTQAAIDKMGVRITELLASSQTAGDQGNVDAAQAAAAQADIVKVRPSAC